MWHGLALLVGTMMLGDVESSAATRADDFNRWFSSAVDGELEIPKSIARKGRSFRYVFIGGFRNERMPGYFAQNMAELRAIGVPRGQIHLIHPSSTRTNEENVDEVRSSFLEIAGKGPEKLVVIAHSRGACDALAFALANAPFVGEHVEALFLIQGPFGGSGVADYVLGDGVPMDRQMPLRHRIFGHLLGRLARVMARRSGLDVVEGMAREASRTFWARTLKTYAEAVATVGPKTFYVRSSIHPSRQPLGRRAIAWYQRVYFGPGDGLVALVDQSLPEIGTVIGTVEAGHSDLTHRRLSNKRPQPGLRRALVRSIVMAVGRSDAGAPTALQRSPQADSGTRLDLREDTVPEGKPSLKGHHRRKSRVSPARRNVPADR